jgi:hypothetical protein
MILTPEQLKKFELTKAMHEPVHICALRVTPKSSQKKYKLYVLKNGEIKDFKLKFDDIVSLDVVGGYGSGTISVEDYVERSNDICNYTKNHQ